MSVEQNDIEGSENDSSGSESFLNLGNDIKWGRNDLCRNNHWTCLFWPNLVRFQTSLANHTFVDVKPKSI